MLDRAMAKAQHNTVHLFHLDGLTAGRVLQEHRTPRRAEQPHIGPHLDAQAVQFGGDIVAHIKRQHLTRMQPVHRQRDLRSIACQTLGQP